MLPSRYGPPPSSALRKSRLEGRPSMLPKPRRPSSIDRLSTEARRPSAVGHRSSSADPPRYNFSAVRLSRDASATKIPQNARSRSQQGYGQSSMTPLRSSQYSSRATTTPVRTPSEDRSKRTWQACLDRALAFVTIKDQRPISNTAWQRAQVARVQEELAARGGGALTLIRPLTIARFVDIAATIITAINKDTKLNTDNYIIKLPNIVKWYLYPGAMSKSWLKAVNTLHAFPHALALLTYLLDLLTHLETPVDESLLYLANDELAKLRREYSIKCWNSFQQPGWEFQPLVKEHLQKVEALLGNNDQKIVDLHTQIQKFESELNDPEEEAARADELRREERRAALQAAVRAHRDARRRARAQYDDQVLAQSERAQALKELDAQIERAQAENEQLSAELEAQPLSVSARSKLLDEIDYAMRVVDSKRLLKQEITKMLQSKETLLAQWQKKTLASCVEYKQALIPLAAQQPQLAALDVDEEELMGAACGERVSKAVSALRACAAALAERRAELARSQTALAKKRAEQLDETRITISQLKASIHQEQDALNTESAQEASEAAACALELREVARKTDQLTALQADYQRIEQELDYWTKMDEAWRQKLSEMREYLANQRAESQRLLRHAVDRRVNLMQAHISALNQKLRELE